jgi:hypothetical protein
MGLAVKSIDTKIINYLSVLNNDEKKAVLSVVETFAKESKPKDFWDELSKDQQTIIDKAIKEADEGKLTAHQIVMKKLRKK